MNRWLACIVVILGTIDAGGLPAASVATLPAVADTTLSAIDPNNNMGGHYWVVVGGTGTGQPRRGLFQFDIAGNIPAGSTIDAVTLTLVNPSGTAMTGVAFDLFRAKAAWGEGTKTGTQGLPATIGEATWNNRLHSTTPWAAAGGLAGSDYAAGASASTTLSGLGTYTWSGPGLKADVQAWLDNAAPNNGWFFISQAEGISGSARRFSSREDTTGTPSLRVDYTAPVPEPATLAMLLGGALAGFGYWRARKRLARP
jgi:hypothetical protein